MYYFRNDKKIYYETRGQGKPLLLLHGLGGSVDSMYALCDGLDNYKCVLVDIPCHGKSDDFQVNFVDLSGSLIDIMRSLGHEKFYIAGISLGSLILETMAVNYPENIIKAAFISPASRIDEHAVRTVYGWFTSEDGGAKSLFSQKFYETHRDEIMEYEKSHPLVPERLFNIVGEVMNFDLMNKRSDIKCIAIYGKYDYLFGERMNESLKKIFPNCLFISMETGHAIHREAPIEAAKIIDSYFTDGKK